MSDLGHCLPRSTIPPCYGLAGIDPNSVIPHRRASTRELPVPSTQSRYSPLWNDTKSDDWLCDMQHDRNMSQIIISPSHASWPDEFQALKALLTPAVPHGSAIHHIGSTAIVGLAAKNVIDIQVSVDELNAVDLSSLEKVGFQHVSGLSDHCPPGVQLHRDELAKLFFRGTTRPANVHIRQTGRFNQRYALVCRDFLRSHPVAANAYALIKTRLAQSVFRRCRSLLRYKGPNFRYHSRRRK